MRITQHGMMREVVANINKRLDAVRTVQSQMTTGLRVAKPSDDPSGAVQILELQGTLNRDDQYNRNIDNALGFLNMTESVLGDIQDLLISLRADVVQGANGSLNENNQQALSIEMDQGLRQLLQYVNQRYHNRSLFGGGLGSQTPYQGVEGEDGWLAEVNSTFHQPLKPMQQAVDEGRRMEVTLAGDDLLDLGEGDSIFQLMFDMRQALKDNDIETLTQGLDRFDNAIDRISSLTSLVGIRTQTLMTLQENYNDKQTLDKERKSQLQDVDLVEAVTRFQEESNAYELALRTAASVIQPSLANFLKL